ncbi:MAG TPA: short chain dehydrogenase [Kofleriaceae bacterium]|jgi:NAD(P)-dependent dehydrogenase (short-subunit alcohol dehydrogenase family)
MKIIVIGASGTIGKAVVAAAAGAGHDVVEVARTSGAHRADISDAASLRALFAKLAGFDAVACAAGEVFGAPLAQTTDDQWARSFRSKAMGQIDVVRAGLPHIADGGSFTLVSGILTDERIAGSTLGSTINNTVEGFVKAAASELPRGIRINCVSPTVLTEAVAYHPFFPGFPTVDAAEVGLAYLRAMSNPMTGRILKLHKTDS